MRLDGKKFLVTGGAGFIGSHLCEALLTAGAKVRIIDDLSTGHLRNLSAIIEDIDRIDGSILDEGSLSRAAEGVDGIFHLAAVVSVPRSIEEPVKVHDVNAVGTLKVLEAARSQKACVVLSSSAAVYGDGPESPKSEQTATYPISPYGVQKHSNEEYLYAYHHLHQLSGAALRYFNVYGPRQDPKSPYSGVVTIFCERALAGQPLAIFGDGGHTRDFVYVGDVVRANLAAMECDSGAGRSFNIGTGSSVTMTELAEAIIAEAGSKSVIEYREPRAGDILHSLADPSFSETVLGFRAKTPFREGIANTVRFFREGEGGISKI